MMKLFQLFRQKPQRPIISDAELKARDIVISLWENEFHKFIRESSDPITYIHRDFDIRIIWIVDDEFGSFAVHLDNNPVFYTNEGGALYERFYRTIIAANRATTSNTEQSVEKLKAQIAARDGKA